jgi:hypothetical protein
MIRKLFVIAALLAATGTAAVKPAPAIDFICSCELCAARPNLGCRDMSNHGRFTSCSSYYAKRC